MDFSLLDRPVVMVIHVECNNVFAKYDVPVYTVQCISGSGPTSIVTALLLYLLHTLNRLPISIARIILWPDSLQLMGRNCNLNRTQTNVIVTMTLI